MKLLKIAPILMFIAIMIGISVKMPMIIDEYVFYRLADSFPEYSTSPSWFFEDRPQVLAQSIEWSSEGDQSKLFNLVYDTPIYTHVPLPVILVSPIVKSLNYLGDKGIIPSLDSEPGLLGKSEEEIELSRAETITIILRIISISLCAVSMWLMFRIMEHKVGANIWIVTMPIATGLMMLNGALLFYWDVFMVFFFVLTLYLMEVKPKSKWKYITACCLVNTKMFVGILLLVPLVIKAIKDDWRSSWKMMLPALSILPFYIATVIVTGEPFYVFTHYLEQAQIHNYIYDLFTPYEYFMTLVGIGMPLLLVMTLPILWFWKKYPEYVMFLILSLVYAWGTGLGVTHTSTTIYAGALVFPLVAHEFRLIERIQGWVRIKPSG